MLLTIFKSCIFSDLASSSDTGEPNYLITPDTLMLCGDGQVQIADSLYGSYQKSKFIASELEVGHRLDDLEIEKVSRCACSAILFSRTNDNIFRYIWMK